jgi:hypothetical protein
MRKFTFLAVLLTLVLSACQQTATPTESTNVYGVGTVTIGADGITTASLSDSFYSVNAGLEVTNVSAPQITFSSSPVGAGRIVRVQAGIRNTTGADIDNLVLLAISLEGLDQSLSPFSNVTDLNSNPVSSAALISQVKPAHGFTLDDRVNTADFVAYAESDLSEAFRTSLQRAAKVPVAAVLPYGFQVGSGTIPNQGTANVNFGFFIPDGNAIGSFTFRFVAVEDTVTRFTQGLTEIELNETNDVGYGDGVGVRQRYGAVDASKTLVLIGPYTRTVAQSDVAAGIFTLLPDIRIMGTADSPIARLLDSGSSDLPNLLN